MAVVGVLAEADVGNNEEFRPDDVFNGANRLRDNSVVAHCVASDGVFDFRNSKEHNAADAELFDFFNFLNEFVERELELAGHRLDGRSYPFAGPDEERNNKPVGREDRIARQPANAGMIAEATETGNGKNA